MIYAYPTEGVWGLGCLPDSEEDVKKINNSGRLKIKPNTSNPITDLDSDENNLFYLLETAAFPIIGFTIIGSIFYITVSYGLHIIRVIFGYQKLWWDDFTFDGENIKSSRFKFKASEIAMIKSETKKFPDSDSWHYASIINSKGDEIGRVMVAYRDKKKMVKYLSDLFGTL